MTIKRFSGAGWDAGLRGSCTMVCCKRERAEDQPTRPPRDAAKYSHSRPCVKTQWG